MTNFDVLQFVALLKIFIQKICYFKKKNVIFKKKI